MMRRPSPTRRGFVAGAVALAGAAALPPAARATPQSMARAIADLTGGVEPRKGRIALDLPQLADTGASVALGVKVESPMTAQDHVKLVAVFAELNPLHDVARFRLGPRCGRAEVATRIRLNDSQRIVAVAAMSDGTFWQAEAQVIITISACIDISG